MGNQKDTTTKVIDFTANTAQKTDPLTQSVMAEYMRLMDLTKVFSKAVRGLIKAVQGWNSRRNLTRELSTMPDYLLSDIGIRRDQIPGVVSGKIVSGSLSLSPTGDQSAPAFYKDKSDTPLAA